MVRCAHLQLDLKTGKGQKHWRRLVRVSPTACMSTATAIWVTGGHLKDGTKGLG
jgi:hypothetical protein